MPKSTPPAVVAEPEAVEEPEAAVHAADAAELAEARQIAGPERVLAAVEANNYLRAQDGYQPIAEGE